MPTKVAITGSYVKQGSQLIKNSHKLVVCERKKTTPSKPKQFLVLKLNNGQSNYLSSLYPTADKNIYNIEYLGTRYKLRFGLKGAAVENL